MSSERALITGIGGFIGANLARALIHKSYSVHALWKKSTNPWRIAEIKKSINLYEVDLSDLPALTRVAKSIHPQYIFHLAAHGAYASQTDANLMEEVNVRGTLHLLQATLNIPYKIFVNTGTSSEYGFKTKPMKETDLLEPTSVYAATKATTTLLCQVFARMYDKPIVTLRPFSVYGPFEEPSRFVPIIIRAVITQTPIRLTAGEVRRDFVYVDDVINAYLKAMTKAAKLKGEVFNVGTGKQYTNDEVVATLFSVTKRSVLIEKRAFAKRAWDTSYWVADTSHTKDVLGWQAKYTLAEGLKKTYTWLQHNLSHYELITKRPSIEWRSAASFFEHRHGLGK